MDIKIGFYYRARAYSVDDRIAQEAALLENAELNAFLDKVLPRHGKVIWHEYGHNLVTNVGARWLIIQGFITPQNAVPWYVMPKSTGSGDVADTASSHGGWTEITGYSQTTRPTLTLTTPTTGRSANNTSNLASITANASVTVAGFALVSVNTKSSIGGTLFSVSDFASSWAGSASNILRITATVSA